MEQNCKVTIIAPKRKSPVFGFIGRYNMLLVAIILFIVCTLINDSFVSVISISGLFKEIAVYGFLALGVMPVIVTGGIDLSVASMASLSSVVATAVVKTSQEAGNSDVVTLLMMIAIPIALCMAVGYISGLFVSKLRMPPLVVTLGMQWLTYGTALYIMKIYGAGAPIAFKFDLGKSVFSEAIKLGDPVFLSIPLVLLYLIAATAIMFLVLKKLRWGREIYATGGNEYAARISGIKTGKVYRRVYMMSGLFASLAGLAVFTTINGVGDPKACNGYELYAIAATVMGGASLQGGKGNIINAVFGIACLRLLYKLILFAGWSNYSQNMIVGGIILVTLIVATSNAGSIKGVFKSKSKKTGEQGVAKL